MPPFNFSKVQTHSRFTSKSDRRGNEEQIEGGKMEVDSVVALKSRPIEPKVTSNTEILSGVAHGFSKVKGAALFPTSMPINIKVFFNGTIHRMLSNMTVNNERANSMVEFDMEGGTSILVQLETIVFFTTITLNLVVVMEILGLDVRVEEIEATTMEE